MKTLSRLAERSGLSYKPPVSANKIKFCSSANFSWRPRPTKDEPFLCTKGPHSEDEEGLITSLNTGGTAESGAVLGHWAEQPLSLQNKDSSVLSGETLYSLSLSCSLQIFSPNFGW